jgi:hypothetical protein
MAAQVVAMQFALFVPALGPMFAANARIPLGLTASVGIAAGALAGWLGWRWRAAGGCEGSLIFKVVSHKRSALTGCYRT